MSLVDPHAIVDDAFALEAAELKSDVGRMFEHLITACCRSCRVLENLAHQTVATARVCRVHDLHLLLRVSRSVPALASKEMILHAMVSVNVFRSQQGKQIIHVYKMVGKWHNEVVFEDVAGPPGL